MSERGEYDSPEEEEDGECSDTSEEDEVEESTSRKKSVPPIAAARRNRSEYAMTEWQASLPEEKTKEGAPQ